MNPPNDEAHEVSCSRCGARPGVPCDMPPTATAGAHVQRRDLAEQYRRVLAYEQRHGINRPDRRDHRNRTSPQIDAQPRTPPR